MDYQAIAETVLLSVASGLLGWRGGSKVKTENARDALVSRHDGDLLVERNKAVADLDSMRAERDKEKDLRVYYEGKVRRRDSRILVLEDALGEFAKEEFNAAKRWMAKETDFADLDDLPQPPKRRLPPPRG